MNKEQWEIIIGQDKTYEEERKERVEGRKRRNRNVSWYGLGLVGEVGFTIATPIIISIVMGSLLDKRFMTYPILTLVFLMIGLIVSFLSVVRIVQEIINKK